MIITLSDCRRVFYCSKGIRLFCTKYKIDYNKFLTEGIDSDTLLSFNDSMADKIVEAKRGIK